MTLASNAERGPSRFRKKPVVVEAVLYSGTDESIATISAFAGRVLRVNQGRLTIETLEGDMTASVGDWIIKGVKGEFYPCKPDIFETTYEPA
jgi:hypothetical protein